MVSRGNSWRLVVSGTIVVWFPGIEKVIGIDRRLEYKYQDCVAFFTHPWCLGFFEVVCRGAHCWAIYAREKNRRAHVPPLLCSGWWNQHCSRSYPDRAAWNSSNGNRSRTGVVWELIHIQEREGLYRAKTEQQSSGFAAILLWLTAPRTPMDTWFWGCRTEKRSV